MLEIKGRFNVPRSLPDAFGLLYPGAFLFGEHGTTGRQPFARVGTNVRDGTVQSSGATFGGERHKSIDVTVLAPAETLTEILDNGEVYIENILQNRHFRFFHAK